MAEFLAPGHQFHKIKAHKDPLVYPRYWVLGNQLAILLWRLCPSHGRQKRRRNKKRTQILAPSTFARTKHGRRQKEEPTSKRRRIVCGALRRPLRWLSGGAGPPAVTPHRVAGEPGGARRPESIETAEPTAKRVKLKTAHRSLVLLQARRTFCCPTALGCRTQTPSLPGSPGTKPQKKAVATQKKPLVKPRRRITTGGLRIRPWSNAPSSGALAGADRRGVGPHSHVRVVVLWLSRLHCTPEGASDVSHAQRV